MWTGRFLDECYGFSSKKLPCTGGLYLWSEQNPAKVYRKIECAVFGGRNLADAGHDMRIESLAFEMSGVHGVSGKGIRTEILGWPFSLYRRLRLEPGAENPIRKRCGVLEHL